MFCNKKLLFVLFCLLLSGMSNGQIIRNRYIAIQGGAIDFSTRWLKNPQPQNHRISAFSCIEYGYPISDFFTVYSNISLGHLKNMGADFQSEIGSDFFRIGLGLLLNPNNGKFFLNNRSKMIEPYGIIGYNFDIINQNPAGFNRTIGSVCFGAGFWTPIADKLCVGYRYSINQRLAQDYRTFNQHTIGMLISLGDNSAD